MPIRRQRAIPPDLFTSEELIALPIPARHTLTGLYMHADDQGRETATLWQLKGSIWPGDPEITEDVIVEHLLMLEDAGWIVLYRVAERTYFALAKHPTPSHPKSSIYPPPPTEQRRNADGSRTAGFSAWERAREDGESDDGETPDGLPPSPFCRDHQPAGSGGKPCVRCQDARLAAGQWRQQRRRELAATDDS